MQLFTRRNAVIIHDLLMVAGAWNLVVTLRYLFEAEWGMDLAVFNFQVLPALLLIQGLIFQYFGLYRGVWRFASLPDLWNILRATLLGTLAGALYLVLFNRLEGVPRTALLLYPLFLTFLLGGPRLLYRLWREESLQFLLERGPSVRVLILGAGRSGESLVRDMRRNREYLPVAFLDDEARLRGGRVRDVPVLGGTELLPELTQKLQIDLLIIAMPSASDEQMQRVVELCEQSRVPFRTLPKLQDMVSAQASLDEVREVSIEDLLGRDKVQLDWSVIEAGLRGKVVMVSGGGGSIGSELCRQIARLGPAALVVFERCEYNLYKVELQLREEFPGLPVHIRLGDVGDTHAVEHTLRTYRPQIVFHAAAHKHVPMLQFQVREAARNNILGTRTLAEAAAAHGCQAFVLISTDKAVNPTNIMGTTKRVAELFCQGLNAASPTRFVTVRFGNVLGSAGSVVPLFQRQIAKGGPVTVTHPEITRYFMTIPEACQLILQAAAMGQGGEIFVLDMGRPVRITYLAEQLIRLSGKLPGKDIQIVYTGLRPGEKLHEELFHIDEEQFSRTRHDKIMLAASRINDWPEILAALDDMRAACADYDESRVRALLRRLVPEYHELADDAAQDLPGAAAGDCKSGPCTTF